MVRREDERAATLRAAGAQVVVGDLLDPGDVYRVVSGCGRVYFGMSVSAGYLEATVTMAAVAREAGVNALVNMSQMTVSEMSPVTEWLSIGGSAGIGFETAHRARAEGAKVCNQH